MNTTHASTAAIGAAYATSSSGAPNAPDAPPPIRTSDVLRSILTKNPGVKTFSVERILSSIGTDRFEASLMMFSIPGMLPLPGSWGFVAMPAGTIGGQMFSGRSQIILPRAILRRSVSRRALAVAIHAILPTLQAVENLVRPRWTWVSHASSRRAIGLFVFLLALASAFPLFGFTALHATSIFVMALGMAEQDGLAVLVGVAVGLLSLALLAGSGLSARALRARAGKWLRKLGQKLGLTACARFLKRLGYRRLARLLTLQWSDLLLTWDPENTAAGRTTRVARSKARGTDAPLGPKSDPRASTAQLQCSSRAA